ncbi:MAG: hypothetical protein AAFN30_19665 [Actinomycetota bacterium]
MAALALLVGACSPDEAMATADLQSAAVDDEARTAEGGGGEGIEAGSEGEGIDATGSTASGSQGDRADDEAEASTSSTTTGGSSASSSSSTQSGSDTTAAPAPIRTTTTRGPVTTRPRPTTTRPAPTTTADPWTTTTAAPTTTTAAPTTTTTPSYGPLPSPSGGSGYYDGATVSFSWNPVSDPNLRRYGMRIMHRGVVVAQTYSQSPSISHVVGAGASGQYCAGITAHAKAGSGATDSVRNRVCFNI